MNRLVLLFPYLLAACSSNQKPVDPGPASKPAPPESEAMPVYQGPAVECSLETMESQPPQFALNVKITVPSGGYELVHDRNEPTAGGTRVLLTLTGPAADEGVIMVLEDKRLRIPLGTDPGKACLVSVRQQARNTHYIKAPEHQLARVVPVALKK